MTPPVRPEMDFDAWKAEQEFNAWKAQQTPAVRTAPTEPEPTAVDKLRKAAGFAGQFSDAATFGVGGLVGDALSALATSPAGGIREGFARNRAERRANAARLSGTERVATTLAGVLANPAGAILRAPQGAGLLARIGYGAGDAALQGGATAGAEGLDALTPEGVREALASAGSGATGAVVGAGLLRGGMSLAHGAQTIGRVAASPTLGATREMLDDATKSADDLFFGQVRKEAAANPTSPAMRSVLTSQTVAPFANIVRRSEEFGGADDATQLLETYKHMSEAQRKAANAQEGTAELLAGIRQKGRDIGLAKGRMIAAASPSIPTLPIANAVHAANMARTEAFTDVADAVGRIMRKASQKDEKIKFESPEALRTAISKMTPSEADAAIQGVLGRGREAWKLSSNMLTGFGIPGAAVRTALLPSQVNPYLRLLEKQAGRQPRLFDNPVVTERALGTTARTIGGLLSDR